jgi:hypothetical protein
MARIPEEEIERIKREIPVADIARSLGVDLKPHGKNLIVGALSNVLGWVSWKFPSRNWRARRRCSSTCRRKARRAATHTSRSANLILAASHACRERPMAGRARFTGLAALQPARAQW